MFPQRIVPRWLRTAAALVCLGPAAGAGAQADPVLRDADAPAFVTVLRADLARTAALRRGAADVVRDIQSQVKAATEAAEVDPLAYVRSRTAHLVTPPDARYDAACSRAASRGMLSPQAVFAVGRPADDVAAALRAKLQGGAQLSGKDGYALLMQQARGPAGQAADATIRFYRARGFRLDGPVSDAGYLSWPGPTRDPITVGVYLTNAAAKFGGECERLGNTALLVVGIEGDGLAAVGRGAGGRAPAAGAEAAYRAALARAGLSEERYTTLLGAASLALREVQDPHEAEQVDAMTRVPGLRAQAEGRQRNRAWLTRHRDDVLPVLEAYARSLAGTGGG
jgi:hypothetical protein